MRPSGRGVYMSKMAAGVALLIMSSSAPATQWHLSGGNQDELILIDKSSVQRAGNTAIFWDWTFLSRADQVGEDSFKSYLEVNCNQSTMHIKAQIFLRGSVTSRTNEEISGTHAAPDSLTGQSMRSVCNGKYTRHRINNPLAFARRWFSGAAHGRKTP
jgi:hypothetical protein